MLLASVRWLARNFGTLLLSLILAFVVWVSAVVNADPNEEGVFGPVTINIIGQDPSLLMVGDFQDEVNLTLSAPRSIWATLDTNPELISAWIDLSTLGAGEYTVGIQLQADISPIRILEVDPEEVKVTLEPLMNKELPIDLVIEGEPPLGYRQGEAIVKAIRESGTRRSLRLEKPSRSIVPQISTRFCFPLSMAVWPDGLLLGVSTTTAL